MQWTVSRAASAFGLLVGGALVVVACDAAGPGSDAPPIPPADVDFDAGVAPDAPAPDAPVASCAASEKACNGKCVAIDDPAFGCGPTSCTPCVMPGGGAACEGGKCVLVACGQQRANCDGDPENGCETDVSKDVASCGACGAGCTFGNATAECKGSVCALGTCKPGYTDCNKDPNDGCETFTNGNVTSCGKCGNVCPTVAGKTPKCTAGVCGQSDCQAPLADCDGNVANGCETNTTNDVAHCSACNQACSFANAAASCANSACVLGACNAGFGNCDDNPANGCETNTRIAVAHCGGCNQPCVVPNAVATCVNGVCGMGACAAGFADLDGALGCEYKCPVFPKQPETCNGKDDDCDGVIDEGVKLTFYRDADGDGFGDPASTTQACAAPPGYVANNTDCNDANVAVHPGAPEMCNQIDDDCNGTTDVGAVNATTFFRDADNDGYGTAALTTKACVQPAGYVAVAGDCDDNAPLTNPGGIDDTVDGIDQDCDAVDGQ